MTSPAASPPRIAVTVVTYDCADTLPRMLESLRELSPPPAEVVAVDNASRDASPEILRKSSMVTSFLESGGNVGFSRGQNLAIRATTAEVVLCLNPDAIVTAGLVAAATAPLADPRVGMVSPKLLRTVGEFQVPENDAVIDSTGIVWTRNGRHLDRGAGEIDRGQYDVATEVFGPSGAAAIYRRSMLEDVAVEGEYFDEDFWAYREDADLAWRARLMGHEGRYAPGAVAYHRRRVTPERRSELPAIINYHSVKNRFLLRIKNQGAGLFLRNGVLEVVRDLQVAGYVLLGERSSLGALADVVRLLPRTLRKRRAIQARRRVPDRELARWFGMAR